MGSERAWYSGRAVGFQPTEVGSTPTARSIWSRSSADTERVSTKHEAAGSNPAVTTTWLCYCGSRNSVGAIQCRMCGRYRGQKFAGID